MNANSGNLIATRAPSAAKSPQALECADLSELFAGDLSPSSASERTISKQTLLDCFQWHRHGRHERIQRVRPRLPSPSGRGIEGEGEASLSPRAWEVSVRPLKARSVLPHPGPLPLGEGEWPAALDTSDLADQLNRNKREARGRPASGGCSRRSARRCLADKSAKRKKRRQVAALQRAALGRLTARFTNRLTTMFPLPFRRGEGQGEGTACGNTCAGTHSFPLTPTLSPSTGERENIARGTLLGRPFHGLLNSLHLTPCPH